MQKKKKRKKKLRVIIKQMEIECVTSKTGWKSSVLKFNLKEGRKRGKNIKKNKIECSIKMVAVILNISVITKCKWTKFSPWINIRSSYMYYL